MELCCLSHFYPCRYELQPFEDFEVKNVVNAIKIRKAKDKHSEFYHSLNNLIDNIKHYNEAFKHVKPEKKAKRKVSTKPENTEKSIASKVI